MLYDFFASSPSTCSSPLDCWPQFNFESGNKSLPFTKAFEEEEMNSWGLMYATQAYHDLFRPPKSFQEHEYHRAIATRSLGPAPEGDESRLDTPLRMVRPPDRRDGREVTEDIAIPPTPTTPRLEMMRDASCSTLPSMDQFQILQNRLDGIEAKNERRLHEMERDQLFSTHHITKLRDNVQEIFSFLDPAIGAINQGPRVSKCSCAVELQQLRLEVNRLNSQDYLRNSLIQILNGEGIIDEMEEVGHADGDEPDIKDNECNGISAPDDAASLEALYPLAPNPPTLIHHYAKVPSLANISGLGVSICPDATVAETAYLHSHSTIATGATIEGGAIIKKHAFISEGATVQVGAVVEESAVVAEGVVVPMGRTVRAGRVFRGMDVEGDGQGGVEGLGPDKKVEEWMVEMRGCE